jgi:Spy/CpxP family protein refolding chaperone
MGRIIRRLLIMLSVTLNLAVGLYALLHAGGTVKPALAEVALTRAQTQDMAALQKRTRERHNRLQQELQLQQNALPAQLKTDTIDRLAIKTSLDAIAATQKSIQELTVEEILGCKHILSKDQCGCLIDSIGHRLHGSKPCCPGQCPMADKTKTK